MSALEKLAIARISELAKGVKVKSTAYAIYKGKTDEECRTEDSASANVFIANANNLAQIRQWTEALLNQP